MLRILFLTLFLSACAGGSYDKELIIFPVNEKGGYDPQGQIPVVEKKLNLKKYKHQI